MANLLERVKPSGPGLFLLLMTWFFLLTLIFVLGAELNAFLTDHGAPTVQGTVSPAPGTQRRRRRRSTDGHRPQVPRANGHVPDDAPAKVILWAGLAGGMSGFLGSIAEWTAASTWRKIVREEPPRPARTKEMARNGARE